MKKFLTKLDISCIITHVEVWKGGLSVYILITNLNEKLNTTIRFNDEPGTAIGWLNPHSQIAYLRYS